MTSTAQVIDALVQHSGLRLKKEAREAAQQQQAHVTSVLAQKGAEEDGVEKRQAVAASSLAAAHAAKPGAMNAWRLYASSPSAPLQKLAAKDVCIRPAEIPDLRSLPVPATTARSTAHESICVAHWQAPWHSCCGHAVVGPMTLPRGDPICQVGGLSPAWSCLPPLLPPRWRLHPSRTSICATSPRSTRCASRARRMR
jgi:hypothetical protein